MVEMLKITGLHHLIARGVEDFIYVAEKRCWWSALPQKWTYEESFEQVLEVFASVAGLCCNC
ncbi:hypothetical protein Hanom_Chr13g01182831 [Helianthus anomalus]